MTKRKASVALEDDNQSDNSANDGVTEVSGINSGDPSNSSLNEDVKNHALMVSQDGSSSGNVVVDGRAVQVLSNDNQNDNSNSSSLDNSNNQANTTGGSGGHQNKGKKERADNWSSAEIQVLHRGIESRRDIFYGPPSQATKKNRELAWDAITKEVNAVSTTPRSLNQVMKKFKNEKCRAKRKFLDPDKELSLSNNNGNNNHMHGNTSGNTNINNNTATGNNVTTTSSNNDVASNLRAQQRATNHNSNQQQQLQHPAHLMTATGTPGGSTDALTTSINVVKLAPQNVAKTMIDLPGHVQHTIQMPNDDMVLIMPPDMDGLLSGVNIVSDGNGNHHFQKCPSNSK